MTNTIQFNKNYLWYSQDDYVAQDWQLLDLKNIDVLDNWYETKLWEKSEKLLQTNNPITSTIFYHWWSYDMISADTELYKTDSADNTPVYTFNTADTDHIHIKSVWLTGYNSWYLFIWKSDTVWNYYWIHRLHRANFRDENWSQFEFDKQNSAYYSRFIPKIYVFKWVTYICFSSKIVATTDWDTLTDYSFSWYQIVWLTQHWSQYYVYWNSQTWKWQLMVWNWWSTISMRQELPFNPIWVTQSGTIDYITDDLWNIYIWSWLNVQPINKSRISNRWFTWNNEIILNLGTDNTKTEINSLIVNWYWYVLSNYDTYKWIYKVWALIPWLPVSLSKIITNDVDWDIFDYLYTINNSTIDKRIYFWYSKNWNNYLWYINYSWNNNQSNWYIVYPIKRVPNRFCKQQDIRITYSNCSLNNKLVLYARINWWDFEKIKDLTNVDNSIKIDKITKENKEFIDIQYAIEFINWNNDEWPKLHWFEFDFKIIKK